MRWSEPAADYPRHQAAEEVTLHAADDTMTVTASRAGWAWLRVPWDPYWSTVSGTPILKGGPGHLVVWVDQGTTELRWGVPRSVDASAAAVTTLALAALATFSVINRRRGFPTDMRRPTPASDAVAVFADTVDAWARTAAHKARRTIVHPH